MNNYTKKQNLNARKKHRLSCLRHELNFLNRNPVFQGKYVKWLLRVSLLYFSPTKLQEICTALPWNSFKTRRWALPLISEMRRRIRPRGRVGQRKTSYVWNSISLTQCNILSTMSCYFYFASVSLKKKKMRDSLFDFVNNPIHSLLSNLLLA